eukprot:CCRYP_005870-RJ/>CCRYP_005870-RJ protein AED:0.41 eAED:0.41 QI:0/0.33/0.3/1/0.33/0.3/10/0/924
MPASSRTNGHDSKGAAVGEPSTLIHDSITGGVDDLIGLTHLHEPAILHALRLRYTADIIYTSTGPILLAINPFKTMEGVYGGGLMDLYRRQGERPNGKLPPHVYQTADDAYRAMMRPTNQSILVSGESGAGKTVTTKIVLNYFAMLSRKLQEKENIANQQINGNGGASIEQQVLQSNPIVEAFGNARTMRNDNSSRFGKYINIAFTSEGKLLRASIDTYLLEKVRLIHQCRGERNFHIFYQFLASASRTEREELCLNDMTPEDFLLTNQSETYDRRDGVSDVDMHNEMVEAMQIMNFGEDTVQHLMRLIVAILFAGNMTFAADSHSSSYSESCSLEENEASLAVAKLLGVSFDKLAASLTTKVLFARGDIIHKGLDRSAAEKANEALIKSMYGAAFDFITEKINLSINAGSSDENGASIGVLDIFGFETFDVNNFEQLCINYTNETLQQQFNKFVFKLEQQEYEREGILWKFIPFPDNQDVLDLIDKPRTGILQLLDEQCMVNWGSDEKFSLNLYSNCEKHSRFSAGSAQKVRKQFSVEHYAGYVEYTIENWLEKNKDQLPAASVELLESSEFELIGQIKVFLQKYVRSEGSKITTKSLGKQFSDSLKILRARIDATVPHYVRCLKPNDELAPDNFDPKQIVEQLRYCGVLEAVRVSRAGYPTRYPHDVFLKRYYMLGDPADFNKKKTKRDRKKKILLARHRNAIINEKRQELIRLVNKLSAETWQPGMFESFSKPKLRDAPQSSPTSVVKRVRPPPAPLPDFTPIPQSKEGYLERSLPSRYCLAGMQLCHGTVFLRPETFARLEDMRNTLVAGSSAKIQAAARRKIGVEDLKRKKAATIKIQSVLRMVFAKRQLVPMRKEFAAALIQSVWRMSATKRRVWNQYWSTQTTELSGKLLSRISNFSWHTSSAELSHNSLFAILVMK